MFHFFLTIDPYMGITCANKVKKKKRRIFKTAYMFFLFFIFCQLCTEKKIIYEIIVFILTVPKTSWNNVYGACKILMKYLLDRLQNYNEGCAITQVIIMQICNKTCIKWPPKCTSCKSKAVLIQHFLMHKL
jgi:hypothetical protein